MPRASNGVYSLPAGNPVVTGTTIASTWANTTMSDMATAMTDSLDRSGFGGMLASLQLFSGSAGSPGLSWSVETNSGLYRAGAGDFRYSIAATDQLKLTTGQLLIGGTTAPGFTATLGLINAASSFISAKNTGASIEAIFGSSAVGSVVGSFTNHPLEIRTNNTQRVNVSTAGNVTINTPTSGTGLTINGISGSATSLLNLIGASGGSASMILQDGQTGTRQWIIEAGNPAIGNLRIRDATAGADRVVISNTGTFTVSAPTSGTAASITGLSGVAGLSLASSGAASTLGFGWNVGLTSNAWNIYSQSTDPLTIGTAGGTSLNLVTNSSNRIQIASGGAVVVNAPSAGIALSVAGVANTNTAQFTANSTSGQSFGPLILGGTTAADYGLSVRNQSGSSTYLTIRGDGLVQAADQAGTLQDVGWRDVPQNIENTNYSFVLADRGKHVYAGSGTNTYTIPANGSVAFPIGSAITIVNNSGANLTLQITTDTLNWFQGGSTSAGTRTIATGSIVTIVKITATAWALTGNGIS